MLKKLGVVATAIFISTSSLFAFGPHDGLDCLGCHSPHFAVDDKIFAVKNTQLTNPVNGQSLEGLSAAKCLGCHQLEQFGGAGIRPIHLHTTHPIGIVPNPKIASVPANLLKDGKLDCISCHEPHPSNKNALYLRIDVGESATSMQNLCALCHSAKVDMAGAGLDINTMKVFSAMDQSAGAGDFPVSQVRAQNNTPKYVKPLGKLPKNDLVPNYQDQPDWVYAPTINPYASSPTPASTE